MQIMLVLRCTILEVEMKTNLILLLLFFILPIKAEEPLTANVYQVKDVIAGKVPNGEYIIYGLLYSDKELFLFQGIDSFSYFDEKITLSIETNTFRSLHGCYVSVKGVLNYFEGNNRYYISEVESIKRSSMLDLLAEGEKEPLCIIPALIEVMKQGK